MYAHHQRFFVVAAVENADPTTFRQTFYAAPEIVVIKYLLLMGS
jgi:hypothetical protein